MKCPTCSKELKQRSRSEGYSYICESCGGEMFHIAVLKNMHVSSNLINEFWKKSHASQKREGRKCPHCQDEMFLHYPSDPSVNFSLEVCGTDSYVWLDKGKIEKLPVEAAEEKLADESIQALKLLELEEQFKRGLKDKEQVAYKSKSLLAGFIPGAAIGIILCLLFAVKSKIFTAVDLVILTVIGAILGGFIGYYIMNKMTGGIRRS